MKPLFLSSRKLVILGLIMSSSYTLATWKTVQRLAARKTAQRARGTQQKSVSLPLNPVVFTLTNDPIDVVIPAIEKDLDTLNLAIDGIREHGKSIRDIYVVSKTKLTDKALWISEEIYPFTLHDVAVHILKGETRAHKYLKNGVQRMGWYYQQLLKLYSHFVIPNISSNILVLDSDTIFLNPVSFMDAKNRPLFCTCKDKWPGYFEHAGRLIPGFKQLFESVSGVTHHMLFQKDIIHHLFKSIEDLHGKPAWQAICECVSLDRHGNPPFVGLSEFEIYFNYVFANSHQGHIRNLKWANIDSLDKIKAYKQKNYHFVSAHTYMRKKL